MEKKINKRNREKVRYRLGSITTRCSGNEPALLQGLQKFLQQILAYFMILADKKALNVTNLFLAIPMLTGR